MKKNFAVIDREGFFRDSTKVYSTHETETLAVKAASRHRVSVPGNRPNQCSAIVIRSNEGFKTGATIYRDTIGSLFPVVWR